MYWRGWFPNADVGYVLSVVFSRPGPLPEKNKLATDEHG
jgi:hypothetical protein